MIILRQLRFMFSSMDAANIYISYSEHGITFSTCGIYVLFSILYWLTCIKHARICNSSSFIIGKQYNRQWLVVKFVRTRTPVEVIYAVSERVWCLMCILSHRGFAKSMFSSPGPAQLCTENGQNMYVYTMQKELLFLLKSTYDIPGNIEDFCMKIGLYINW